MTAPDELAKLEAVLLTLGRWEIETERTLESLESLGRLKFSAGDESGAEDVWAQRDRSKHALLHLRQRIYAIENKLYAARRRRQN